MSDPLKVKETGEGEMTERRGENEQPHQDRLSMVVEGPFKTDSLVGSYFHGDDERQWQGCVVAEPSPGVFLVELFEWLVGSSSEQRLVRLDEMTEWHFYDDAKWMNNAYNGGISRRWERASEARDSDDASE